MIFVTIDSALEPFNRLLDALDEMAPRLGERVIMQCGRRPYPGKHTRCYGYITFGPVLMARRYGKPLVIVPRDPVHNELFDDHQLQTARATEDRSRMIEMVYDVADLSLGDAWHPRYRSDRMGLNLLLVRSAHAAEVVRQLRDAGAVALEDVRS